MSDREKRVAVVAEVLMWNLGLTEADRWVMDDDSPRSMAEKIVDALDAPESTEACRVCGKPLSEARAALGLTLCSGPCHKIANALGHDGGAI